MTLAGPGSNLKRKRRKPSFASANRVLVQPELDQLREEVQRLGGLERRFESLVQLNVRTQATLDQALAKGEQPAVRRHQWPNRDRELHFLHRQMQATGRDPGERAQRKLLLDSHRKPCALFDAEWYLNRYPQVSGREASPLQRYIRHIAASGLAPRGLMEGLWYVTHNSRVTPQTALLDYFHHGLTRNPGPLFDTQWYLEANPQIEHFRANPLAHYLQFWATEGGDPHPLFDTNWYLRQYEDVKQSGVPPLLHYVVSGAADGRDPNPLFDTDWYLRNNPDVAAAGLNPLAHYIQDGAAEGRKPHPLFDGVWYSNTYPDVARAGINPLTHYLLHGATERRDPHPLFLSQWYASEYPQVAKTCGNLLVEYLAEGAKDQRDPNPFFDSSWYLKTYRDVAAAGINPLIHYAENGQAEGRNPSPQFNTNWYREEYPDVVRAGIAPLQHYLGHGRQERRDPLPTPEGKQSQAMRAALRLSAEGASRSSETRDSPLISILLPTYNSRPGYLHDAIQSVRNQTYDKWELCVVDDGSQVQSSLEYLRQVETEDPRIRVCYRAMNGGIAEASQQALEMAHGEFVAFLDHDDVLAPHALAEVTVLLGDDPSVAMVYTDHAMMDEDGKLRSPSLKPQWSHEFFLSTNYIVHLKVIRRTTVFELGGFRDSLNSAQDVSLTCRLAGAGHKVRHLPKVLYYWRMHPGSVASKSSAKPAIESSAVQTYNDFLTQQAVPATMVWPDSFRKARLGAYKLEFKNSAGGSVAVVIPALSHSFHFETFLAHYRRTDFDPVPPLHLITAGSIEPASLPGLHHHLAATQQAFDDVIDGLDCDWLVFLSPSAKTIASSWLKELIGYLSVSSRVGAVGGKVLDAGLHVQSGGLLLLNRVTPICHGDPDESDGYWFNNRIASNVEAVSSRLMATRKSVYQETGGVPFYKYSDAAGVPYCLKLRQSGYRVVYTPWSKVVDPEGETAPAGLEAMLASDFGPESKRDRYYHPFFSKDVAYALDPNPAAGVIG